MNFLKTLTALHRDRRGVTALEYGLIAALIAVVIIGTVTTLGSNIQTSFSNVASSISGANSK
jgi:pilus assembly protein Flp/PilA